MKPRNSTERKFANLVARARSNPHRTSRKLRALGHRYDRRASHDDLNTLVGLPPAQAQEAAHELQH